MLLPSLLEGVAYAISALLHLHESWYVNTMTSCTVSVLFVVFLMGNVNEYDKSMQLRIIPNQKSNRNLSEMHEISKAHSRNREISSERNHLEINKKSGNLSEIKKFILEIKKFILEIKRFRNLVQNIRSLWTPWTRVHNTNHFLHLETVYLISQGPIKGVLASS